MSVSTKTLQRKESILESATKLFEEHSIEHVSMSQIAHNAGISKGALYLEFESKDDIIVTIALGFCRDLNQEFSLILTQSLTGLEMLQTFGHQRLEYVKSHPMYLPSLYVYQNIVARDGVDAGDSVHACKMEVDNALSYIIRAAQIGISDGSIRADIKPEQLGLMIFAASKGMLDLFQSPKQEMFSHSLVHDVTADEAMKQFMQVVLHGIKPIETELKS
jgi:AcrR family transcriptional regulator